MRIEKTVETSCAPVAKGGRLAREGDTSFFTDSLVVWHCIIHREESGIKLFDEVFNYRVGRIDVAFVPV
jgi:hypothetical protein